MDDPHLVARVLEQHGQAFRRIVIVIGDEYPSTHRRGARRVSQLRYGGGGCGQNGRRTVNTLP